MKNYLILLLILSSLGLKLQNKLNRNQIDQQRIMNIYMEEPERNNKDLQIIQFEKQKQAESEYIRDMSNIMTIDNILFNKIEDFEKMIQTKLNKINKTANDIQIRVNSL